MNATANRNGTREAQVPTPQRAQEVEVLDPGRHDQQRRGQREVLVRDLAHREHVVRPHAHREPGERQQSDDERRVAEEAPPRERREHLGDHADEREEHHVHDRVPVEPEQLLVVDRAQPARQHAAEVPLRPQQPKREQQRGEREHDHQAGHDHRPGEDRHPQQRHPGRTPAKRRRQHAARPEHLPERSPSPPRAATVPFRCRASGSSPRADRNPTTRPPPRRRWSRSPTTSSGRRRSAATALRAPPGRRRSRRRPPAAARCRCRPRARSAPRTGRPSSSRAS